MDDEGQNKNPNDSGAPQGIFSTPELTVDTEKVNQASAASEEKARSRVASIFANTETGKQAQKLNDAMGMNSQPVDGDIVIDNRDRKKRSKVPIIVAVVVAVAAVGVGAYFLISQVVGRPSMKDVVVALDSYGETLSSGLNDDTECKPPEGTSMLEYLGNFACSQQQRHKIMDSLQAKFNEFRTLYNESKIKDNDSISSLVNLQGDYLVVISRYLDQAQIQSKLAQLYNIGESPITLEKLYNEKMNGSADSGSVLARFSDDIDAAVTNLIAEYQAYARVGCILSNNSIDRECANLMVNSGELGELPNEQNRISSSLVSLYPQFVEQMLSNYNEIKKAVGDEK